MYCIAAIDRNGAIGANGELLFHIRADLQNFKALTTGKVIVYGRKTLKTFPGGKPLKNRTNIILSRDPDFKCEGALVCHSIEELIEKTKDFDARSMFVIGGESIYRQLQPYIDCIYLTRVDTERKDADAYFFFLDSWWNEKIVSEGEEGGLHYKICKLTRSTRHDDKEESR